MKKIFLFFIICTFFAQCAHSVHLVQANSFDNTSDHKSSKIIEAKSEQFVILGLVTQTDYVDQAYRILQEKCEEGTIQGVVTQYSTSLGFFSWTNKILMKGLCIR